MLHRVFHNPLPRLYMAAEDDEGWSEKTRRQRERREAAAKAKAKAKAKARGGGGGQGGGGGGGGGGDGAAEFEVGDTLEAAEDKIPFFVSPPPLTPPTPLPLRMNPRFLS